MTIVAADSVSGFFLEVVEDALKAQRVEATGGTTSYLVSLLADFTRPDTRGQEAMDRPLAFLLDEALHAAAPAERFDRLRALGDGVLYTCGFFGESLEARGVDHHYVIGIGQTAYGAASSMLRVPGNKEEEKKLDVFGELAAKFATFVAVLAEVACSTITHGVASSREIVKLYERWLKTGNERIAQTLSAQGLVPMRGNPKVVQ